MKNLSLITLFLFLLYSCVDQGSDKDKEISSVLDDSFETKPLASGQVKIGQCYEEQYAPSEENINRKIDIVIVPDTSASIIEEREKIAQGFEYFINSLPSQINFRIAVVLGHGPNSSLSGKLYQKSTEPRVLDSDVLTKEEIINSLSLKLKNPSQDSETDGGEMGIYSFTKAITTNLATNKTQGFFREDAALAVVFVADEQDICAEFPVGVSPVIDPQGAENNSYNKYCVNDQNELLYYPEQVIQNIKTLQSDRPFILGGVLYNNSNTITYNGENEIGYGYLETIQKANGLIIDLANGSYGLGLEKLGKLAMINIAPTNQFALSTDRVDLNSIKTYINNQAVANSYDPQLNAVLLKTTPDVFDVVNINYCEKVESPKNILKIISGGFHNCALLKDSKIKCWGKNNFGQLGLGHTEDIGDDELPQSAPSLDFGQKVIDMAAGLYHTCVLLEDGNVKCFGDNSQGQLGQGHTNNLGDNEAVNTIPPVNLGQKAVKIYAGTKYNCALLENQYIKCWGENNYGQLGYGHTNNLGDDESLESYSTVPLGDKAVALDISTISYHTCAVLKSNNSIKCWGLNNNGQLGYGHTENLGDNEQPNSYSGLSFGNKVLQISTGFLHTCSVNSGQSLSCWGSNNLGQIGLGYYDILGDDETINNTNGLDINSEGAQMVSNGNAHTCFIGTDESLYCFGASNFGQTGLAHTDNIGDNENIKDNTKVQIDLALSQVSAGINHTCALTKDEAEIICFGANANGQLGLGHTQTIGDDETPWEFVSLLNKN
ncbi:MAG: hypothetical protein QF441_05060 [Bacteriovoracaceae bacterium]|jgi:alpha-tubulin suppressor-like RCC1 family protein|nr:hypothetical protein [Bacteriovoracaceae bacterium]